MRDGVEQVLKLASELWPRWQLTDAICDVIAEQSADLPPAAVCQAMRTHRLERSTVPDLGVVFRGARAIVREQEQRSEIQLSARARQFTEHDAARARASVDALDETARLWYWRYCRLGVEHSVPWSERKTWPHHWSDPCPPSSSWPIPVLRHYAHCLSVLGDPHERARWLASRSA